MNKTDYKYIYLFNNGDEIARYTLDGSEPSEDCGYPIYDDEIVRIPNTDNLKIFGEKVEVVYSDSLVLF